VGLDAVYHMAPSVLDHQTLRACVTKLPDVFLQGVGYTPHEIDYLRVLYSQGLEFYSCFISHGSPDERFVDRLTKDLIARGISTWHYRKDMTIGGLLKPQIGEAIKMWDKLLLVCSKDALARQPVIDEIIEAIEFEGQQGSEKLFPIRLDDYIFSGELTEKHGKAVGRGDYRKPWLDRVRAIWIGDFRNWKDHDAYGAEFENLCNALRKGKPPPKA
jgi:hypothetical protein